MAFAVIAGDRTRERRQSWGPRPRGAEPGNLDYHPFRDPKDPSLFVLFERCTDEAALDADRAAPHFGEWLAGQILPNLKDRVGLDLISL